MAIDINGINLTLNKTDIVTIPLSFEANLQTTTRIYFPDSVKITRIRGINMSAIEATNNGTVTCGNATGASTAGVLTCSGAINAIPTATVPTTNNTVIAGSYYYLTSAKVNAGGSVLVTLEYIRT